MTRDQFALALLSSRFGRVGQFAPGWTVAHQASWSLGFSSQEYWNVLSCPSPEDLPDPGIKLVSPALAGGFFTTEPPGKPPLTLRLAEIKQLDVLRCW